MMEKREIIQIKAVSDTAFILEFERGDLNFEPGTHVSIGLNEQMANPYSIYSGVSDVYLSVLIKEVPEGRLSSQFRRLKAGDYIYVGAARGHFIIEKGDLDKRFLFIASGTGIAPFHSMIASFPMLNYFLLHGIRDINEAYESTFYDGTKVLTCTSRSNEGGFKGRVTDYISNSDLSDFDKYYICGSYQMIDDVYDLLIRKGINKNDIFTEGYF